MTFRDFHGALVKTIAMCALSATSFVTVARPLGAQDPPPKKASVKADPKKLPKTLKIPTTFEGLFAERDARAKAAVGYLRCLQGTVNALRGGALGAVPREWSIACVEQKGEWRGVFGELGETGILVHLQFAPFRGEHGVVTRDPVDTARVNGSARALLRGLASPLPGAGRYEFTPVPLPQGTFMELWFLPVPGDPARPVVGGDSLIQMTTDGMRELGHGKSTPPIRVLTPPSNAQRWTVPSREERIPTVSELMAAYRALEFVAEVTITTRQYESTITRNAKGWKHRQPL